MKIYDISQEVYGCTVFPGDPSPQKTVVMRVSEGDVTSERAEEIIRLAETPDGVYLLNAAPLNLGGSDGAPVRAILLEL